MPVLFYPPFRVFAKGEVRLLSGVRDGKQVVPGSFPAVSTTIYSAFSAIFRRISNLSDLAGKWRKILAIFTNFFSKNR